MKQKYLNAHGNGEVDYDSANDILFFRIRKRMYAQSIDFEDIVVDIDKEGFITGVQVFNATRMLHMPKTALQRIKNWELHTKSEGKVITIHLTFETIKNKVIENIVRESASPLEDAEAVCVIEA